MNCTHCGRKYCKCWKSTTPSSSIPAAAAQPLAEDRDTVPGALAPRKGNRRSSQGLKSVRPGRALTRDRTGGVK